MSLREFRCQCGTMTALEADEIPSEYRIARHDMMIGVVRGSDDLSPVLPDELGTFVRVYIQCPYSLALVTGLK